MVLTTGNVKNIVALAGGVGGAKLAYGLSTCIASDRLTVIGNVADDFTLYGLHISPDLDTVMYTLAGIANPATGWGIAGETWQTADRLRQYGADVWFNLGDRDLATHMVRTQWLAEGLSLTEVTARLARALKMPSSLLPVTDDPLATMVDTVEYGTLPFQVYFVKYRWQPAVKQVVYHGVETSQATQLVLDALHEADVIVFCPSNPVLSLAPILAVPGVRAALLKRRGRSVAVSPFVGGKAVKGPADKLMGELGLGITPADLVQFYNGLLDGLVVDVSDREQVDDIKLPVLVTKTLMETDQDKHCLAEEIIQWVEGID